MSTGIWWSLTSLFEETDSPCEEEDELPSFLQVTSSRELYSLQQNNPICVIWSYNQLTTNVKTEQLLHGSEKKPFITQQPWPTVDTLPLYIFTYNCRNSLEYRQ